MRKNAGEHKGSILCTASNAGLYGFPIAPMYGTSKHAIVGAVRSMAKPLQADGIQINAICPNCIGMLSTTSLLGIRLTNSSNRTRRRQSVCQHDTHTDVGINRRNPRDLY